MQQGLLFDCEFKTKKARKSKRKTGRSQHRRQAWEDYCSVSLFVGDLFNSGPLPKGRKKRVATLQARYAARTPIFRDNDSYATQVDYLKNLTRLGQDMWNECMAQRGLREVTAGIHAADNGRWRVRPWNPNTQRHVSMRDGYADTHGEAVEKLIAYWKGRGIDIRYKPPEWFVECLGIAIHLQADASEAAGGLDWAEVPVSEAFDDDDDD